MSSAVPAALACVASRLRCPVCHCPLVVARRSLTCARGHVHDVARHGYVTLLPKNHRLPPGDDAPMIDARAAIMDAGHFEPLTTALTQTVRRLGLSDASVVLDAGAGTSHHLAAVLARSPGGLGIAVDVSRPALRRAGQTHQRIARVRADIWREIPLGDASVDLGMSVFAPRNTDELARVLRPGGAVIVATPAAEHLRELADLHSIRVHRTKTTQLKRAFATWRCAGGVQRISWQMVLGQQDAASILGMGPAAHHLRPDFSDQLTALAEPLRVTGLVELRTFLAPTRHLR
jgi:23S rRNA (guanine745-N1)-methyltransferase